MQIHIKATELRIGNYINYCDKKISVKPDDIKVILKLGMDAEIYEPIPLTEEWLLKFGFKSIGTKYRPCYRIQRKERVYEFVANYQSLGIVSIDTTYYFADNIIHVHQLQNLYFALTGEELTLKEEL